MRSEAQKDFERLIPRIVKQAELLLNDPQQDFQPFAVVLDRRWTRQVVTSAVALESENGQDTIEQDLRRQLERKAARLASCVVTTDWLGEPDLCRVLVLTFQHCNGEEMCGLVPCELRGDAVILAYNADVMFPTCRS
jgi:hypothetical protein